MYPYVQEPREAQQCAAEGSSRASTQERSESSRQRNCVLEFAFPNHQGRPPHRSEPLDLSAVPSHVLGEFSLPKLMARFWDRCLTTTGVLMPKASVHKDRLSPRWENQIRAPRQVPPMESKPVSERVCKPSDDPLRFRIFPANAPHEPAAFRGNWRLCLCG
jgi:hypothetical protein